MNDNDIQRLISVLEEIRDNQKLQLERHAEALSLQREQSALVQNSMNAQNACKTALRKFR